MDQKRMLNDKIYQVWYNKNVSKYKYSFSISSYYEMDIIAKSIKTNDIFKCFFLYTYGRIDTIVIPHDFQIIANCIVMAYAI